MATPTLIFCAGGSKRHAEIAVGAGFRYGARLPSTANYPVYFADQDYKKPDRAAYMAALAEHKPVMATVLDWETEDQLDEVMSWVEEASVYVQRVVIIPKVLDIARLPHTINGKDIVIGYSIPTTYGGTCLPVWELTGRKVHLLGGSPHRQMKEYQQMRAVCDVVSCDGNMHMKMANQRCCYWTMQTTSRYGHWQPLNRAVIDDAPYECFKRSCLNIVNAWRNNV